MRTFTPLVLFATCLVNACQTPSSPVDLAITNVSVINIASGTYADNRTVLIDEGRIVKVQSAEYGKAVGADEIIDAQGAYLMPGLWDMHIHLHVAPPAGQAIIDPAQWHVPLALSYGVTGLRDMASRMDDIVTLRAQLDAKRDAGQAAPELLIGGTLFSGPQPWGEPDHAVIPATIDDARAQVAEHIARGVDFIKVHDFLAPDIYRAIVDEAIRRDQTVIGHLRSDVGPMAATSLGQRDFEHIPPELLAYCHADGQARTRAFYDNWFTSGPGYFWTAKAALYNPEGCQTLFTQLAQEAVTITPTLILRKPVTETRFELASRYLPEAYTKICEETRDGERELSPDIFETYDAVMREVVSGLSESGVTILAGTDRQTYACGVPGWDVIQELKALEDSGLSRRQALQTATIDAAHKTGRAYPGQIVADAEADLILLDANPLDNLDALETPRAVISAGEFLSSDRLQDLREGASAYALTVGE